MKRAAGRPQDIADIDALLTVRRVQRSLAQPPGGPSG